MEENLTPANPEEKAAEKAPEQGMDASTKLFLLTVFLVLLVIGAYLVGRQVYHPLPKPEQITYHGFIFTSSGGMWQTNWQRNGQVYSLLLHYNPPGTENIPVTGAIEASFNRQQVFISFDPEGYDFRYVSLAAAELSLNMARGLGVEPVAACTKNVTDECALRPIKTCDNINESVIALIESNQTSVYMLGNCIVVQGQGPELVRAVDRLLYIWYGIMS